jgi:hypothetical protein
MNCPWMIDVTCRQVAKDRWGNSIEREGRPEGHNLTQELLILFASLQDGNLRSHNL